MKLYKGNKTFRVGPQQDLNACVGNNGFNDIGTYEYGYDKAVNILIDAAKTDHGIVDPIIYPLVFSARHRIELFLKKATYYLVDINKRVGRNIVYLTYLSTHDIKKLWEYVKLLSNIDERYSELVDKLNPYIEDYYIIDLTGETFRYPYDKSDVHHLDDFSCINIGIFQKQYNKASSLMENFKYLNQVLYEEYKVGTFTDGLSRCQIEAISKILPERKEWINPSFNTIRESIKTKYHLSSRALSRVINIIQSHREFSENIGISIPVNELTIEQYKYFKEKINEFQSIETGSDYITEKNKYCIVIGSYLPSKSILSLMAFKDIGYFNRYSEDYDPLIKHFSEEDPKSILFMSLMDSKRIIEWIEKGMKICGQSHLLR